MDPIANPPLSAYIGMVIGLILCLGFCLSIFLWALLDCLRRVFFTPAYKPVWVAIIILVVGFGPVAYLIVRRHLGFIDD